MRSGTSKFKKYTFTHMNFMFQLLPIVYTVPVGIWSTTMPPGQQPAIAGPGGVPPTESTALADPSTLPEHGCDIDGQYYMDGMQVLRKKP